MTTVNVHSVPVSDTAHLSIKALRQYTFGKERMNAPEKQQAEEHLAGCSCCKKGQILCELLEDLSL